VIRTTHLPQDLLIPGLGPQSVKEGVGLYPRNQKGAALERSFKTLEGMLSVAYQRVEQGVAIVSIWILDRDRRYSDLPRYNARQGPSRHRIRNRGDNTPH
jgi:hypothetical protein